MLMEVKNQIKISLLSIKYACIREMLNKTTFITNIIFMILNNASFIIQWIILYSLRENVGGYTFKQVMILWALAAGTYGISHFIFKNAYVLSDTINNGKLDSFLVQPKNVLLSCITSDVEVAALGDLIYAYIVLFICGCTIKTFLIFTFFSILGGLTLTSLAIIFASLSFWFQKSDVIVDTANGLVTNFATYPDGIFKGVVKFMLYTIVPVGFINYIPVALITSFNIEFFTLALVFDIALITLAFVVFYSGLKKYSSSNLMIAKI